MTFTRAVVSSPASIANFGPGFDAFGLCLDSPRDRITIMRDLDGKRSIRIVGKHTLPTRPERNVASYAAMKLAEICGKAETGFVMTVRKGMKPGSGLGSSAASSVGGALAMAALLGVRDRRKVLEAAAMGEELVSGSRHFDNVAAAIYGGFTIVSDVQTRTVIQVSPPRFQVIVALPEISIKTRNARAILPKTVKLGDAVANVGWASGMMHAMMKGDIGMIGRYLNDKLAMPYRRELIPGYEKVQEAAMRAGAVGVSIGGSGPAVFAISQTGGAKIKSAMVSSFRKAGLRAESFITYPGKGATIESVE